MLIKNSAAPIGADITDIDLSGGIDARIFDRIVEALHARAVIVFRGQGMSTEQQVAFSRRFGDLDVNVRSEFNKDGRPEVLILSNIQKDGKPIGVVDAGRYWHTDLCYKTRPERATLLHTVKIPVNGLDPPGDTLFASMTAAYEAVPAHVKERIANLKA